MRQVFFDVLLSTQDEPIIVGLLYEKQAQPAILEWLRQHGKAGLQLTQNPESDRVFWVNGHGFTVVER